MAHQLFRSAADAFYYGNPKLRDQLTASSSDSARRHPTKQQVSPGMPVQSPCQYTMEYAPRLKIQQCQRSDEGIRCLPDWWIGVRLQMSPYNCAFILRARFFCKHTSTSSIIIFPLGSGRCLDTYGFSRDRKYWVRITACIASPNAKWLVMGLNSAPYHH